MNVCFRSDYYISAKMSRFQSRLAPKQQVFGFSSNINNNELPKTKEGKDQNDVRTNLNEARGCICNRPQQVVMCQKCGYCGEGRIRLPCPSHPSVTFLLDFAVCPNCKAGTEVLKEFPKPLQSQSVAKRQKNNKRRCEMMDFDQ